MMGFEFRGGRGTGGVSVRRQDPRCGPRSRSPPGTRSSDPKIPSGVETVIAGLPYKTPDSPTTPIPLWGLRGERIKRVGVGSGVNSEFLSGSDSGPRFVWGRRGPNRGCGTSVTDPFDRLGSGRHYKLSTGRGVVCPSHRLGERGSDLRTCVARTRYTRRNGGVGRKSRRLGPSTWVPNEDLSRLLPRRTNLLHNPHLPRPIFLKPGSWTES